MRKRIAIHEDDSPAIDDICGQAVDLIDTEVSGAKKISLATIYVDPGRSSSLHYHKLMEEIYYFVSGTGTVRVGSETIAVRPGSAVFIPIGELHQITNNSPDRMKLISADSPPFDPKDIFYP